MKVIEEHRQQQEVIDNARIHCPECNGCMIINNPATMILTCQDCEFTESEYKGNGTND